jgi:hypothetical protein
VLDMQFVRRAEQLVAEDAADIRRRLAKLTGGVICGKIPQNCGKIPQSRRRMNRR